jgi:hypothetical protein
MGEQVLRLTKIEGLMDGDSANRTIWFVGDVDDPWVDSIQGSISNLGVVQTVRVQGAIPARLFDPAQPPRIVVLHRSRLSHADVCRIEGWREQAPSNQLPRIILCFSPYVRYAELERCSQLVELVIPEGTAVDTLPRHILRLLDDRREMAQGLRCGPIHVDVVSSDHELRGVLREACSTAGLEPSVSPELDTGQDRRAGLADSSPEPPTVTLWDVPVLDPRWPELMERRSRVGPVIAVLGFADRVTVGLARASGAAACLGLPFDLDDLIYLLDRITRTLRSERSIPILTPGRVEHPHAVPPRPASLSSRGRSAIRERGPRRTLWSEEEATPRIEPETTP